MKDIGQVNQRLIQRLSENPIPTQHELIIGCFLEELPADIIDIVEPLLERGVSLWSPDNYVQDYQKWPHVWLYGVTNDQLRHLDRQGVKVITEIQMPIRLELIEVRLNATDDIPARWSDMVNKLPSNGLRPLSYPKGAAFRTTFQGSQPQEYMGYPIYRRD